MKCAIKTLAIAADIKEDFSGHTSLYRCVGPVCGEQITGPESGGREAVCTGPESGGNTGQ